MQPTDTDRATRVRRYSETVYLVRATPDGPLHIVSTAEYRGRALHVHALCPAAPRRGAHREGPMYLDEATGEGVCDHCVEALRKAGRETSSTQQEA